LRLRPHNKYDSVVFRGDPSTGAFVAFWLRDGQVLAGMNVNTWDVTDTIETLVRCGQRIDPVKLTDPDVPMKDLVIG
jgi:3-phenylpropionate/trans-cinnamate dioxygenase ferredoxin reductase subunit